MIWTEVELARNPSSGGNKKCLINICENTSESVLQTILEFYNIHFNNLYLLLNPNLGASFCKITRLIQNGKTGSVIDRN